MTIAHPCVYHYLFSHIPDYHSEEEARKSAENLVFRLKTDLRLQEDEAQRLRPLSAAVTLLSSHADEHTETYLSQLLSHDLIATILAYNQTETHEEPLAFLESRRNARFPAAPNRIGETSVFFVQAALDAELVKQIKQIAAVWGETQAKEPFPCCQFEWGALYALPDSAQSRNSQQKATYFLLVPQEKDLKQGDHFLSYSFPILESIRRKLRFEEQEARKFKVNNLSHEQEIKRLLDNINGALSETLPRSSFESDLKQIDTRQAALYQSIAETDALLLTLHINLLNFKNTLTALAPVDDTLFAPMLPEFRFIRQQIEYDLAYIKFLLPGMDKREELLRLKIEWQRKEVEKRSNKIKEFTNALIFSFGIALGIGQMLTDFDWTGKFWAMLLGGSIAFALNRFAGMERVKAIWEAFGWPGKITKEINPSRESH